MFGMLGPTHDDLRNIAKHLQVAQATVIYALIDKGLLTAEDLEKFRVAAIAEIDQLWETQERENNARALEENPGLELFAKFFGTEIPLPVKAE
jgi:hypothetical protein